MRRRVKRVLNHDSYIQDHYDFYKRQSEGSLSADNVLFSGTLSLSSVPTSDPDIQTSTSSSSLSSAATTTTSNADVSTSSDSANSSTTSSQDNSSGSSSPPNTTIIAAAVGAAVGVGIFILCVYFCIRRQRKSAASSRNRKKTSVASNRTGSDVVFWDKQEHEEEDDTDVWSVSSKGVNSVAYNSGVPRQVPAAHHVSMASSYRDNPYYKSILRETKTASVDRLQQDGNARNDSSNENKVTTLQRNRSITWKDQPEDNNTTLRPPSAPALAHMSQSSTPTSVTPSSPKPPSANLFQAFSPQTPTTPAKQAAGKNSNPPSNRNTRTTTPSGLWTNMLSRVRYDPIARRKALMVLHKTGIKNKAFKRDETNENNIEPESLSPLLNTNMQQLPEQLQGSQNQQVQPHMQQTTDTCTSSSRSPVSPNSFRPNNYQNLVVPPHRNSNGKKFGSNLTVDRTSMDRRASSRNSSRSVEDMIMAFFDWERAQSPLPQQQQQPPDQQNLDTISEHSHNSIYGGEVDDDDENGSIRFDGESTLSEPPRRDLIPKNRTNSNSNLSIRNGSSDQTEVLDHYFRSSSPS